MVFIAVPILLFLILFKIKITKKDEFFDSLNKSQTTSINGIFVVLILFSHIRQYISLNHYDYALYSAPVIFTQLIVVSFFFYSGYGLMESIKKKGRPYVYSIATHRFPKVLFDMVIAVCLFLIMQACFGVYFKIDKILLSFIGWETVGNSNWFIFVTLCFYVILFVSFLLLQKKSNILAVALTTILTIGYIVLMFVLDRDHYTFNTMLCLPAGMIFSLCKDKLFSYLKTHPIVHIVSFCVLVAVFVVLYKFCFYDPFMFNIMGIVFMLTIILATTKVSIQNPLLNFLGKYTFWIYILQRIPMIIFMRIGLASFNSYLYLLVCVLCTILLSIAINYLSAKLKNLIWRK